MPREIVIPIGLKCPIKLQIMFDPVIAADGETYEREAITEWFETRHTSPLHGTKLENKSLIPNRAVKRSIEDFLQQHLELYDTDEIYLPQCLKQQLVKIVEDISVEPAISGNDPAELLAKLRRILDMDRRLVTVPLVRGRNLMSLACSSTKEVLSLVISRLGDGFLKLPEVQENSGVNLFNNVAKNLKAPGAKIIAECLGWKASDLHRQLDFAVSENDLQLVEVCLELGANLSIPGKDGQQLLHRAINSKCYALANLIVRYKPDPANRISTIASSSPLCSIDAPDSKGCTALHLAVLAYIADSNPECLGTIHILVDAGASLEAKNPQGDTVLLSAVRPGNIGLVKHILSHKPLIDVKDANGYPPLHVSLNAGTLDIVQILIEFGANIEERDKEGNTLLHAAAKKGYDELAVTLITKLNANCKTTNVQGKTPVQVARESGHVKVAELIDTERRRMKLAPFIEPLQRKIEEQQERLQQQEERFSRWQQSKGIRIKKIHLNIFADTPESMGIILDTICKVPSAKKIIVITAKEGCILSRDDVDKVRLWDLAVLSNGKLACVYGGDCDVRVYDMTSGSCIQIPSKYADTRICAHQLAVLPGGKLASCSYLLGRGRGIDIWDAVSGSYIKKIANEKTKTIDDRICRLAVLPNGLLAAGHEGSFPGFNDSDGIITVWDTVSGSCTQTLCGHPGGVESLAVLPNGNLVSGGDKDYTIKVWDIASGLCIQTLYGHHGRVSSLAVLSNGQLASVSKDDDEGIRLWDITNGLCIRAIKDCGAVYSLAELQNGLLASGHGDGDIKVWDMDSGLCVRTLRVSDWRKEGYDYDNFVRLAALPNGTLVAGASRGAIKVWSMEPLSLDISFRRLLQLGIVRIEISENSVIAKFPQRQIEPIIMLAATTNFQDFVKHLIPNVQITLTSTREESILAFSGNKSVVEQVIKALSAPDPELQFIRDMFRSDDKMKYGSLELSSKH